MYKPEFSRGPVATRQRARRRLLSGLLAVAGLPAAVAAQGRLDPLERERLRQELREAREERMRHRGAHHERGDLGQRTPPERGDFQGPRHRMAHGVADRASPGGAPDPRPGEDARRRMTFEEREALRMQLREQRPVRD